MQQRLEPISDLSEVSERRQIERCPCRAATEEFISDLSEVSEREMLLRISSFDVSSPHQATANNFQLCTFTTEDILSFCVDAAQVLVVDISEEYSDLSSS
eukprot:PhM_4_TR6262/c1_g1_i1/m.83078